MGKGTAIFALQDPGVDSAMLIAALVSEALDGLARPLENLQATLAA